MKVMRFGRSFYFMSQKGFFPPKDITHLPFLYSYVILLHLWHLKYYRNASESLPLIFLGNPTLLWYNLFLEAWWILLESFDYVLLFKQFSDLSFILLQCPRIYQCMRNSVLSVSLPQWHCLSSSLNFRSFIPDPSVSLFSSSSSLCFLVLGTLAPVRLGLQLLSSHVPPVWIVNVFSDSDPCFLSSHKLSLLSLGRETSYRL